MKNWSLYGFCLFETILLDFRTHTWRNFSTFFFRSFGREMRDRTSSTNHKTLKNNKMTNESLFKNSKISPTINHITLNCHKYLIKLPDRLPYKT